MTLPEQQLICTRPFEWFEVHPDGSVFLCCPAWLKRSIGNLLQQSVVEIWNGPVAREIRKTIFNGSFHNCSRSRCPHLKNLTPPICPVEEVNDQALQTTLRKKLCDLPYLPRQLNLCFDHSCNLACPTCRTTVQQARGEDLLRAERLSAIICDKLIPQAHSLTLSGFGDPFGSPTYFNLLKQLNARDFPQLQQLRLHTNGQLLTQQLWQSLPILGRLVSEIEISMDAASEQTYRRNRRGGNFVKLLQNLEFLAQQNCHLTLSMVVQDNNWREIPDLLKLAGQLGADLYLSQLVNWGTFSRDEFRQRSVHAPEHPNHKGLQRVLAENAASPLLHPGNLSDLRCDL